MSETNLAGLALMHMLKNIRIDVINTILSVCKVKRNRHCFIIKCTY